MKTREVFIDDEPFVFYLYTYKAFEITICHITSINDRYNHDAATSYSSSFFCCGIGVVSKDTDQLVEPLGRVVYCCS